MFIFGAGHNWSTLKRGLLIRIPFNRKVKGKGWYDTGKPRTLLHFSYIQRVGLKPLNTHSGVELRYYKTVDINHNNNIP